MNPASGQGYNSPVAIILGLLIFCLGFYFLGLFFQVARLEKEMTESVTLLERYMIVTYALGDESEDKDKNAEGKDGEAPAAAPSVLPPRT